MQLALLLYLASIVDNFREIFQNAHYVLFILGAIATAISFGQANKMAEEKTRGEKWLFYRRSGKLSRKWAIRLFCLWMATMLLSGLVPSKKDVYVMAGGYVAITAANSEIVQTSGNAALNSIEKWLDSELANTTAQPAPTPAKKETK